MKLESGIVAGGYCGRVARVNLSEKRVTFKAPQETFYRTYLGGRGVISYYLYRELEKGTDPLGPENKLVFATGPLTGTPLPGSGRHSIGAKSPLTGGYGDGEAGGFWGAELKRAGFDAIIVEGVSEEPVYLWVHDGEIEIRSASALWGKSTLEVHRRIREELKDPRVRVAQCGPAGERLVRFACVSHDLRHYVGRCGIGAVMGSKRLKAVAVKGSAPVAVADPEGVRSLAKWMINNHAHLAAAYKSEGTAYLVLPLHASGGLPTRNFREGQFEYAHMLSGQYINERILVGRESCFACPIRCKPKVKIGEPFNVTDEFGGPEYETIAALGSNCGVGSIEHVALANQICAEYGLDTISAGVAVSFAMECFENGIISLTDTDGVDLRFGNGEAMVTMLKKIAKREGFGDLLAEGVMRAAKKIGHGAEALAMHVKGQEVPMHEPRLKKGLSIGYAVSVTGADHCHNIHDTNYEKETKAVQDMMALGALHPLPAQELSPRKARMFVYGTVWRHLANSAGMCYFLPWDYLQLEQMFRSVTGWNTSTAEMIKWVERAVVIPRMFNLREGFKREDDDIPKRFMEPFTEGPLRGVAVPRQELKEAIEAYYLMMGFDEKGIPTKAKLYELGLDWLAQSGT